MKEPTIITGISTDCVDCQNIYGIYDPIEFYEMIMNEDVLDEGMFSWNSCDNCNCHLGGTRFIAHRLAGITINKDNQIADKLKHISICTDCLFLIETGEYPVDFIPCN